jgi:hypothetical protein
MFFPMSFTLLHVSSGGCSMGWQEARGMLAGGRGGAAVHLLDGAFLAVVLQGALPRFEEASLLDGVEGEHVAAVRCLAGQRTLPNSHRHPRSETALREWHAFALGQRISMLLAQQGWAQLG